MADISDLHPAIIHALKTGKLDQAQAATGQSVGSVSAPVRLRQNRPTARTKAEPQRRSTEAEDDAFYDGFNNNPLR